MTRNELVLRHTGLVKSIALKMVPPSHPDFNDLVQDGFLGLMEALDEYKPGGAASFATFARQRIHGRMQDGARKRTGINAGYFLYLREGRDRATLTHHKEITHVQIDPRDTAFTPSDPSVALDVRCALKQLDRKERRMLRRVYWHEETVQNCWPHLTKAGASHNHRKVLKRLAQGPLAAYGRTA